MRCKDAFAKWWTRAKNKNLVRGVLATLTRLEKRNSASGRVNVRQGRGRARAAQQVRERVCAREHAGAGLRELACRGQRWQGAFHALCLRSCPLESGRIAGTSQQEIRMRCICPLPEAYLHAGPRGWPFRACRAGRRQRVGLVCQRERNKDGAGLQRAAPRVFRVGNLPWGTLGPDSLCGRLATLACCCVDCVAEGLLLEERINGRLLPNLSVEQAFGQAEF